MSEQTTTPAPGYSLTRRYLATCDRDTDMHDQLPYFARLVGEMQAKRVIELGVREGLSTVAWLYALRVVRGRLWSVDVEDVQKVGHYAHWTFIVGDDLDPAVQAQLPDPVDILFIDTSHNYIHTLLELDAYAPRVRSGGRILLHDADLEVADATDTAPVIPYPVRQAMRHFCETRGYAWSVMPGGPGLGVIEVP